LVSGRKILSEAERAWPQPFQERMGSEAEIGSDDFLAGEIAHGFIAGRAKADFGEGHLMPNEYKISKQTDLI